MTTSYISPLSTLALPPFIAMYFSFSAIAAPALSTLSLHDALPIWSNVCPRPDPSRSGHHRRGMHAGDIARRLVEEFDGAGDRKSTRLNSSHVAISYAVFCLKKKKYTRRIRR